ncbi:hypothetical protein [Empedobacter falsenii]|uniref:hypothetical protein n=1 Tax=Empedobacter falsenii TaxID=343874 RepID=UPI00056DA6E5|nr:hypothetical protein [Empedobacter falsenii]
MDTLKDYQVKFIIKTFFNENFKSIESVNIWLSAYISDFNTLEKVNQLLNDINSVLNDSYMIGGGQTQSMYYAEIKSDKTKIYESIEAWEQNNNIQPDFMLPTTDFKVLVEAWRDFLLTPPLNDTKMS